jgi:L-lactate dehydrogenase complex protein LldE
MAEHFISVFENDPADFIVAPSGSCTAIVRNFYGEMFHGPADGQWRDRLARVKPRLREFSEFVVNEPPTDSVGP